MLPGPANTQEEAITQGHEYQQVEIIGDHIKAAANIYALLFCVSKDLYFK